jgi:hypothetical protein
VFENAAAHAFVLSITMYENRYVLLNRWCGLAPAANTLDAPLLPALQLQTADPKNHTHNIYHVPVRVRQEVGAGGSSAAEAAAGQWVS